MSAPELLPWHQKIWDRLVQSIQQQRLAHALLFSGPAGVGKRQFAARTVASVLCESPLMDRAPCGECRGCAQRHAGSHPGLMHLAPEEGKRDISVDSIRRLGERLSLSRHYDTARIVLCDPADALNANSVNALLKMVEEPPSHTHLIFICERPLLLPATLRSRCQQTRFGFPDADLALSWMLSEGVSESQAADLLSAAGGAPLRALAMNGDELREQLAAWSRDLDAVASGQVLPTVAAAKIDKQFAPSYLEWLLRTVCRQLRNYLLADQDAPVPLHGITRMMDETVQARGTLERNGNAQMVIESVMILWWRIHAHQAPTRGRA